MSLIIHKSILILKNGHDFSQACPMKRIEKYKKYGLSGQLLGTIGKF